MSKYNSKKCSLIFSLSSDEEKEPDVREEKQEEDEEEEMERKLTELKAEEVAELKRYHSFSFLFSFIYCIICLFNSRGGGVSVCFFILQPVSQNLLYKKKLNFKLKLPPSGRRRNCWRSEGSRERGWRWRWICLASPSQMVETHPCSPSAPSISKRWTLKKHSCVATDVRSY